MVVAEVKPVRRHAGRVLRWVALFVVVFGLGVFYAATNQQQVKGLVATVQLYKALGGSWEAEDGKTIRR